MDTLQYLKDQFEQMQVQNTGSKLDAVRKKAFQVFNKTGIPTSRHEEWKYTRIGALFNQQYASPSATAFISPEELDAIRLLEHKKSNELFFINGIFSKELSTILSEELVVQPLETAANNEFSDLVAANFGHSSHYLKDGINALNTALINGGVFIHVKAKNITPHPVYIYNVLDARSVNVFAQPRCLVHISEQAQVHIVETYVTIGASESFTNQVMEIVVEKDAVLEYYKIQNDAVHASQVSTTHIRQAGKSHVHTVTVSLNGGIIRNNLNMVLDAAHCETHLYGLYFLKGNTHVDNHTLVDNVKPNCLSNQLYKGIINDTATGIFNGKIFVQRDAQKTNAYQSNKNILLSDSATVNAKPQLEIFADDVKCSHGCTVGQLDEEGMFYLRSRGISEKIARSLLVHAFAVDVLEHIKLPAIRTYVNQLISERLEFDIA